MGWDFNPFSLAILKYLITAAKEISILECFVAIRSVTVCNINIFYTEISKPFIDKEGFATVPHFSTPEIVEISESTLWINYGKVSIYEKIDNLSEIDMKLLYLRGKKDNRDYIKEYLNLDVREITAPESIIYSEPDKSTTYLLAQGAYLSTKKSIASLATSKVSCCSPRYSDSLKQYLQFKLHFRDGCKHKVNCP